MTNRQGERVAMLIATPIWLVVHTLNRDNWLGFVAAAWALLCLVLAILNSNSVGGWIDRERIAKCMTSRT